MYFNHYSNLKLREAIVVIPREEEDRFEVRVEYCWDNFPFPDFEQGRKEIYWHKYGNGGCVNIVSLPDEPYFTLPTYEERLIEFLENICLKGGIVNESG